MDATLECRLSDLLASIERADSNLAVCAALGTVNGFLMACLLMRQLSGARTIQLAQSAQQLSQIRLTEIVAP
jgi:hypothetical protein